MVAGHKISHFVTVVANRREKPVTNPSVTQLFLFCIIGSRNRILGKMIIKRFYFLGVTFLPVPLGFGVWSGCRSGLDVLQNIHMSFRLGIKSPSLKP